MKRYTTIAWLIAGFIFLMFWEYIAYDDRKQQELAITMFKTIDSQQIIAFKIQDAPYAKDYKDVTNFTQQKELLIEFFQAITDSEPYQPKHDSALAQWGVQLHFNTTTIRVGCYIPTYDPSIVAGIIFTNSASGEFQSKKLLRWYQKYGYYWEVSDYLKVQYGRVMAILKPISRKHVTSFTIISDLSESSEERGMHEFVKETACVTAFFQALEDMRFAAPTSQDYLAGWTVQIRTSATTVKLTCSIPAEEPPLVIGLIDSEAGYTYFQSRKLYQWYQKYNDRWLHPDEAHLPEHTGNEDGAAP